MEHKKQKRNLRDLIAKARLFLSLLPFRRKGNLFIVGTPSHQNVGDLAIAMSELQLIKDAGFIPVEVTYSEIKNNFGVYRRILKNRVVVLHGGGNMGDTWFNEELLRRDILEKIKAKKFIIMPQTLYYSDTVEGQKREQDSIVFYNKNNVDIFLRDLSSFKKASNLYPIANNHKSCDIVLHLKLDSKELIRNKKVLLVFRSDIEKSLESSIISDIKKILNDSGVEYCETDMYSLIHSTKSNKEQIVQEKLGQFSEYSFVVTDRLHGMIFSAITSTPCIAFNNNNKKVQGTYDYLKELDYIHLCESFEDFKNSFDSMFLQPYSRYNRELYREYYDELKRVLMGD